MDMKSGVGCIELCSISKPTEFYVNCHVFPSNHYSSSSYLAHTSVCLFTRLYVLSKYKIKATDTASRVKVLLIDTVNRVEVLLMTTFHFLIMACYAFVTCVSKAFGTTHKYLPLDLRRIFSADKTLDANLSVGMTGNVCLVFQYLDIVFWNV